MGTADQHPPQTEAYLLGELGEGDRAEYEAHLLECETCSADLVAADMMVQAVRGPQPEPSGTPQSRSRGRRPRRWSAVPLLAVACTLVLIPIAAYQGLVTVPQLRGEIAARDRPRALVPVLVRPPTRGTGKNITLGGNDRALTLSLELPPGARGSALQAEVRADERLIIPPFDVVAPEPGEPLLVQLPSEPLPNGSYAVVLRAHRREERSDAALEIAHYPFFLKRK